MRSVFIAIGSVLLIGCIMPTEPAPIAVTIDGPPCDTEVHYTIDYVCEERNDLALLHPSLAYVVEGMLEETGNTFAVHETKRGLCRQVNLMKKGTTPRLDSKHLVGTAVDFNCWDFHGAASWDCDWELLAKIGKSKGLLWGGDFPSGDDLGHFELPSLSPL